MKLDFNTVSLISTVEKNESKMLGHELDAVYVFIVGLWATCTVMAILQG